jgi:hypothetical protein
LKRDLWLQLAHYCLGAIYAERRQAENSIEHLEAVVTSHGLDPMLIQAAEGLLAKLRSRQFPKIALKQLGLMFQQGDMIQY